MGGALHLGSESTLLHGIVHFFLLMLFETAKKMFQRNKDKESFMTSTRKTLYAALFNVRKTLANVFRATVWAFGAEMVV